MRPVTHAIVYLASSSKKWRVLGVVIKRRKNGTNNGSYLAIHRVISRLHVIWSSFEINQRMHLLDRAVHGSRTLE